MIMEEQFLPSHHLRLETMHVGVRCVTKPGGSDTSSLFMIREVCPFPGMNWAMGHVLPLTGVDALNSGPW